MEEFKRLTLSVDKQEYQFLDWLRKKRKFTFRALLRQIAIYENKDFEKWLETEKSIN